MQVKIKRIDKSLPLPTYQTNGAVAFDLYTRIDEIILAGETKMLPTNLIIQTPNGYMLMIASRSSLAQKKGLKMANGVGIIDQDYCGEDDEIKLLVHNYTNNDVAVKKGERLGQGVFVKIEKSEWEEIEKINNENRGGFGSTD
ncbi:MAG: dUTPase [Candidatus Magasanikbacteria bacterium RIFCSPHIGHO2_01_FULL_33_34]|uniref:dUTP diphosphatase n=1 Tax=Candidatus Magasanikbacteria bacterium RIFCSPHIGHO2_01_FULL_33_34 TaxID=1798671 RepID=A0A1F6LJL1_9BACT|nr:MAG: dUTPase [Candidatus Magasanikbacteria bacterium RIFCSPHIGHO2_01_FULL_33_34]OGH65493.1 MAG: dUTPase [Candidatus Magasanikbacteria bacterium RIFCSPHIGHO2_02_FULL_33_17]OGH76203.1 MAG: dUTPase [Candidatus Magasanikbacteria bacterium RIFCSPLOWO2_01_FULL_33_34]OGH82609.1 MAG: dUTPase [Candidatus Magasanikbacteria bacterium RIFCSPLOWO2_12_FULL_34_7]